MGVDILHASIGIDAEDDRDMAVGIVDHRSRTDGFQADRRRIHIRLVRPFEIGMDAIARRRDRVAHTSISS